MIRHNDWIFNRKTLMVYHAEFSHKFKNNFDRNNRINMRFKALEHIVLANGKATRDSLWNLVYSKDEDGGPLTGNKIFDVMFAQLKDVLRELNVELVQQSIAGVNFLEIRRVV